MVSFDHSYLFLLHEFRVWTIIHNITPENRGSQGAVYFLGIDVPMLAVEDKIVSLGSQTDSGLFAQ